MTVHVKDENDNSIEGASVNVYIAGQDTRINEEPLITDSNGEAIFDTMVNGDYKIEVSAAGKFSQIVNENIIEIKIDIRLTRTNLKFLVK